MPSHLRRYDEPGHVHFWTISTFQRLAFFRDDGVKQVVVYGLKLLQSQFGICLIGYVIMPEHVHVLLYPHARDNDVPIPISKLLQVFKQHTGFHGLERLRHIYRNKGKLWSEPLMRW